MSEVDDFAQELELALDDIAKQYNNNDVYVAIISVMYAVLRARNKIKNRQPDPPPLHEGFGAWGTKK